MLHIVFCFSLTYAVKFFLEVAFALTSNTLNMYACLFWPLWRDAFRLVGKAAGFSLPQLSF